MVTCRCGCGEPVKRGRVFLNKEHQLDWMVRGGARQLNALLPLEARVKGGEIAGQHAASSGRLLEAAYKGGAISHQIAEEFRARRDARQPD